MSLFQHEQLAYCQTKTFVFFEMGHSVSLSVILVGPSIGASTSHHDVGHALPSPVWTNIKILTPSTPNLPFATPTTLNFTLSDSTNPRIRGHHRFDSFAFSTFASNQISSPLSLPNPADHGSALLLTPSLLPKRPRPRPPPSPKHGKGRECHRRSRSWPKYKVQSASPSNKDPCCYRLGLRRLAEFADLMNSTKTDTVDICLYQKVGEITKGLALFLKEALDDDVNQTLKTDIDVDHNAFPPIPATLQPRPVGKAPNDESPNHKKTENALCSMQSSSSLPTEKRKKSKSSRRLNLNLSSLVASTPSTLRSLSPRNAQNEPVSEWNASKIGLKLKNRNHTKSRPSSNGTRRASMSGTDRSVPDSTLCEQHWWMMALIGGIVIIALLMTIFCVLLFRLHSNQNRFEHGSRMNPNVQIESASSMHGPL